jgi:SagB-type dehydrogenase family enzyme
MQKIFFLIFILILTKTSNAQNLESIVLIPPDTTRGLPVMKALAERASSKNFDTTSLKLEDLSDLMWAANGINRSEKEKKTAPSALNSQDIDVYAVMKQGIYLYNAKNHQLENVVDGDFRKLVADKQDIFNDAPVFCLLVSDISRFPIGTDSLKLVWAAEDAGIVSQNISIFCASVGLATRPRASMDNEKLREILNLKDSQYLMLNNPVGYKKD